MLANGAAKSLRLTARGAWEAAWFRGKRVVPNYHNRFSGGAKTWE